MTPAGWPLILFRAEMRFCALILSQRKERRNEKHALGAFFRLTALAQPRQRAKKPEVGHRIETAQAPRGQIAKGRALHVFSNSEAEKIR